MPGLIRGVARTAVVAGTATHVSNNVSRRQSQRWAEQEPQQYAEPAAPAAAAPAATTGEDRMEQLQKLGDLKAQGILTEEEFQSQKAKILAS